MPQPRRYHLHSVDGQLLPVALRYGEVQCVVTGGSLALTDDVSAFGDGRVQWELVGRVDGLPGPDRVEAIFWLAEEFDRPHARHLTFPGGLRTWNRAPELVLTGGAEGVEVAPVAPTAPAGAVERQFGARTWQFRALAPSEAAVRVAAG